MQDLSLCLDADLPPMKYRQLGLKSTHKFSLMDCAFFKETNRKICIS